MSERGSLSFCQREAANIRLETFLSERGCFVRERLRKGLKTYITYFTLLRGLKDGLLTKLGAAGGCQRARETTRETTDY